ncbi:MAG: DUF4417 domain-containing protein [Erysipelotrichaceae bacterium]|nr:DUF4417 domain-containing protein [Erysipelotrichaceae bacterium]
MKLQIKYRNLDDIKPYEGNVKRHPEDQIKQIMESIKDYGFNDPIAIDETGTIIEGHGRYEACKCLGIESVPTIELKGLTEEQKREYIIVHNKITMNTGFDMKMLQKELKKIGRVELKKFGLDEKFFKDHDYKTKTQGSVLNILNLGYAQFPGVGKYDIPQIQPEKELPEGIEEWIGFNYVLSDKNPENKAVHFFVDDYQFERVWNRPDQYIPYLKRYKCVLSPDFSPYGDMPLITQIFNHYRKHWIAAYWQSKGITVIPTIRSSTDPRSLEFYLDGEPTGGVVAYSSMWSGSDDPAMQKAFRREWNKMISVLHPTAVIVYGSILPIMESSNVQLIQIPKFTEKRWNGEHK